MFRRIVNRNLVDVVFDNDVCTDLCISPKYLENFEQKILVIEQILVAIFDQVFAKKTSKRAGLQLKRSKGQPSQVNSVFFEIRESHHFGLSYLNN